MKYVAQIAAITLIINLYSSNSFAQENLQQLLNDLGKSNSCGIAQIEEHRDSLGYVPFEPGQCFVNQKTVKLNQQPDGKSRMPRDFSPKNGNLAWYQDDRELNADQIKEHFLYAKNQENNYYDKKSGGSDPGAPDAEQKESSGSFAAAVEVSAGVGRLSGDTTYRIGYPVHWVNFGVEEGYFPISQLEFPLDVHLGAISASLGADVWLLRLSLQKEMTRDAGDMKDSDWLTASDPSRLDIYSTSATELEALILDLKVLFRFFTAPNGCLTAGVGYLRENFDFKCRLIRQNSPSGAYAGWETVGDGSVGITYEIIYEIPYLEIGAQLNLKNRYQLEASLGYSPMVHVKDEDHHILRNKVNKGDLDGDAVLFSLQGRYAVYKNLFLALQFDYRRIETDKGDMVATFGGADSIFNHTVTEEVESEQLTTMFTVGLTY